jgi:hypothetical protein
MPPAGVLPAILLKSVLLAVVAGYAANRFKRISIPVLALVVLAYQFIGTLGEWAMVGNFALAFQDFRIGIREWDYRFSAVICLSSIWFINDIP